MTAAGNGLFLESDGISEDFFALLWTKDEFNFGPCINIPDTVIFKHGLPTCWYFTTVAGTIKRKNRQNLVSSRIEESFTSHVLGYDILATFISFPVESVLHIDEKPVSTIEYFDKQSLYDFLYKSDKKKSGILQRFIEPKGTKNDIIRAIWSPKICLLERTENIYHLHDQRFGLYERCVTHEGPDYFSIASSVRGAVLAGQIQKVCETVVAHISEVTYERTQLSRVVINLKVDSRDKLWLLFTTSIQCGCDSQGSSSLGDTMQRNSKAGRHGRNSISLESTYTLPDMINLNPIRSYEDIAVRKPKMRIRCVSCSDETLDHTRHPVPYKSVVKHYEHVIRMLSETTLHNFGRSKSGNAERSLFVTWPPDQEVVTAAGCVGFGCMDLLKEDSSSSSKTAVVDVYNEDNCLMIPPILRYLHPKLNATSYERCRKDPLFLYKTVTVCESCFLVYADFTTKLLRMGQNVTTYLRSNVSTMRGTETSTLTRPSSADWRAMSSVHRSQADCSEVLQSGPSIAAFHPSENHSCAKSSAIGMRHSDKRKQPGIPSVIRRGQDTDQAHSLLNTSAGGAMYTDSTTSALSSQRGSGTASSRAPSTGCNSREKEKSFFTDIGRGSHSSVQQPLMHLITAQERLNLLSKQNDASRSASISPSVAMFGPQTGKQSEVLNQEKYSSYKEEIPYLINRTAILPSKIKEIKELKKLIKLRRKSAPRKESSSAESDEEAGKNFTKSSESSDVHREFLQKALKSIESDP